MSPTFEELEVSLRSAMAAAEYDAAAEIAVQIDKLKGEPIEDDRVPEPIPCWGTDAE